MELGRGWAHHQQSKAELAIPKSALREGAAFAMPEQLGKWTRLNAESPQVQKVETMGVFSQAWHYQNGETVASVALDYPFAGYHDVTLCYTLRGWKALGRVFRSAKETKAGVGFAQVQMQNEVGLNGVLWFSTVDERGNWQDTPPLEQDFLNRWKVPTSGQPTTYRVQVLATSYGKLAGPEQEQLKEFFEMARTALWQQLAAQMRRQE